MESSYDLAYVISRGIILLGCVACGVMAARAPRVRPLAWLGVVTMVAALLLGCLPTMGIPPQPTGAFTQPTSAHTVWHGWSAVFFGIGVTIYLAAIIAGQRRGLPQAGEGWSR